RFIFYNLIGGIIQYCRENDTISVGLSREKENKNVVIIVTDTSEYYLTHHHRNAFYHAKPNTERAGLLLINQLVEKLNGSINMEYKSPKGTVFKISLPICNEEVHNDRQPIIQNSIVEDNGGEDNSTGKPIPAKENPSLLIVESNKDIIYYLSSLLKSSYQIFTVDNGEKAVRDAIEIMPDIILANIVLPGINGCDLCKEIKSSDSTSHIPVILLSTYSSKEERIEGIRCGADAFLSRPVHDEELLAVINQSLEVRRQISNKYALATVNTGNGQEDKKVKNDALTDFIKHITDLIYKEITKTDGIIEIIADKTCLSTSQLNRKIKAATGMTTSNYILKIKLNKAAQLLARTQKPIGEIAMSCGFNDFAYFSRTFKKEFNMTPTSFQRLPHSVN
ncbi:MAG: helix-turn-helix domain-containing protein, partial [Proteiniphilum sp.]